MNDSEDERATDLDDCFEEVDVTLPVSEGPVVAGLLTYPSKSKGESENKGEDDEYLSEDLLSSDPDASEEEKEPRFDKFKKEELNKDFNLNGVGHKHSYAIKTIKDTHTCARILDNKSASSKWVAKAVVKKMRTSDKDKEYANLWRYAAELHRVNPGNTVKINIERPLPTMQPRNQGIMELKAVDPKAWAWLMAVPTKSWCKHAFSFYPKCDVLMNNIAESFNATILNARDKPILTMCEWIRKYLMSRCSNSTLKLDKWPHKVMPIPRKRLDNEVAMSGHRHVVAALGFRQQNPEDFVHQYYTRDRYAMCYEFAISPINGTDMWPEVESEELLPPNYKKGPGRPRKLRIRESGEEGDRRRLPGVSYRCTRCDKVGHNVKTCKSKRQNQSAMKRKKKMRPNASEEGTNNAGSQSATNNEENEDTKTDSLFGDITDDKISNISDIQSQASTSNSFKGKGKMIHKPIVRRRVSERIKENWFKKPKPFTGPGSHPAQPICMDIEEEEPSNNTPKKASKITPKKPSKGTPKKASKGTPKKTTPKKGTPTKKT
ncbi:uncharacterized protein LOC131598245 [Vicia villosa]|uniref:uncharacterized protein LOC131598245 n=1 Tax=Vicia villosa TaxID=3911 RepID=UPI00273AF524|nr:uncharacterized protein LOC131598245 [Vicia villosa]